MHDTLRFRDGLLNQYKPKHLRLYRRGDSPVIAAVNPKCYLCKYFWDGEIAPPAILHFTDINRSSQDTQQLKARQTEPVRHRAEGVGGAQGTILFNNLSQVRWCQQPQLMTVIAFSHISWLRTTT